MGSRHVLVFLFAFLVAKSISAFEPPKAKVQVFSPRGFSVSIPAESGITLFAFHGKVNEEIDDLASGTWNADVTRVKDGHFTYINHLMKLNPGDTLHYWTYVIHNGLGYHEFDGRFSVDENTPLATAPEPKNKAVAEEVARANFVVPEVEIELLQPRGFQASIPALPGITLFVFHAQVNEEFSGMEPGIRPRDIRETKEGRFVHVDRETRLKEGDVLHYWVFVEFQGLGYQKLDGKYVVGAKVETAKGCQMSNTLVNGTSVCIGQLIFEENFDGNLVDFDRKWTKEHRFSKAPDYEFVSYISSNVALDDGIAKFQLKLYEDVFGADSLYNALNFGNLCTGVPNTVECSRSRDSYSDILPPVITGRLSTKDFFSFKYGKVEVRAKLPEGDWIFPPFEPPNAKVQVFSPRGFSVSIPAESGITLFAFHGKVNEEIDDLASGTWNADVTRVKDGYFTYINHLTKLNPGDTLHYWTYVIHNGLGYHEFDGLFSVDENTPLSTAPEPKNKAVAEEVARANFVVPDVEIELLQPRGFQASIPALPGISLFVFHAQVNEEFEGLEGGIRPKDIRTPTDGKFVHIDRETKLKEGDVLHYWIYVVFRGLGYQKLDQQHLVGGYDIDVRSGCKKAITQIPRDHCAGDLLFEDNFSGNKLDSNKWTMEHRFSKSPDYEFVTYMSSNIAFDNGIVKFEPKLHKDVFGEDDLHRELNFGDLCSGILNTVECFRKNYTDILPPVISTRISTNETFSFTYGRVEVRAKLPEGDWVFPQIFLEPKSNSYGSNDLASGQMRIAFSRGGPSCQDELLGGVLFYPKEPTRSKALQSFKRPNVQKWSDDYHVFELEWKPNSIMLSVDGEEYGKIRPNPGFFDIPTVHEIAAKNQWRTSSNSRLAPFDQEFYITLGVGVGGFNDFNAEAFPLKPWTDLSPRAMSQFWAAKDQWYPTWNSDKTSLKVDYVRVYAI